MSSVVYREVEVKSALNAVKGMPFDWSLNPWSGCAHKCTYCFARAYHARYREKNVGTDFDSNVEVRVNIADVLRKELRRRREGSLAIGTATDPYQPIEGKYRLTRRCLEALVEYPMPTSIVTKGPLVVRDIDVLKKLDERTDLTVYFSVPCVDEEIVRKTDPGTAPPRQRLRALRMLREAGIDAAVLCMPVLPGITDLSTPRLAPRARRARPRSGTARSRSTPRSSSTTTTFSRRSSLRWSPATPRSTAAARIRRRITSASSKSASAGSEPVTSSANGHRAPRGRASPRRFNFSSPSSPEGNASNPTAASTAS